MKVANYNQMMAYIRRPKSEFTLPEPKPQELLEIQEDARKERLEDTMDETRPFLMDESVDFIERENFDEGTKVDKRTLRPLDFERREQIKQFILDDIKDFEKNRKRFPNEKYQINQDRIIAKLKEKTGTGTDPRIITEVIESLSPTDKKKIATIQRGKATASKLPEAEQDFFAKNYKAKTISQMATEITEKPYDNKITKAKSAQLYRHYLSQVKLGNVAAEEVPKGTRPKGSTPKEELKTFENYRKAQKQLMDLDPKTYKNLTPSMLDNRIRKALQFSTVRGAFNVPASLAPSFEHFQGVVPSTIIEDPDGLRKAGITTKDYNFNVMGAKAKKGMYKTIKNNIRTAKEFFNQGNTAEAKKTLNIVNEIYDDVSEKLKYIDRKKLPKYSLGKEGIKETNLKAINIGTEKRLGNTIEDYIKFVATGPKRDIAKIKQPNLAKAVEMVQEGEDIKELVKSRLPDIREGQLFANPMSDPTLIKEGVKEISKSPEARNLFKGAGRIALGELAFAPASIVLDTYAGLTPEEMILNVATFGLGTPLKDSVKKRQYISDLGYGKAYQSALTKRRNLRTAPESKVGELTEDEKQAIFLSNVFDTQLELKRGQQAEDYQEQFEGQLKRGELEVLDDSQVLEAPTRVEPEVPEEEEEGLSPFFDKILGTFRSNLASGSKPSNEEMIDLVLKYGKNKKTD
jgi:hypothetical protein